MSTIFLKFEAIESRIASYSCPRGVGSSVHTLRLRRCFRQFARHPSKAVEGHVLFGGRVRGVNSKIGDLGHGERTSQEVIAKPYDGKASHSFERIGSFPEQPSTTWDRPEILGDVLPNISRKIPSTSLPSKHREALYSALRKGNPRQIMKILLLNNHSDGYGQTNTLLERMPPTTFSEVLRCLDPKHFLHRYAELYRESSPGLSKFIRLEEAFDEDGHYRFYKEFLHQASFIVKARYPKWPLTLSEFKYLLRCAEATGQKDAFRNIWTSMNRMGIKPDAECYNRYMAVLCWNDSFLLLIKPWGLKENPISGAMIRGFGN